MGSLIRLFRLFSRRQRREFAVLVAGVMVMAFVEVVGIGSIGPFISLAMNPEQAPPRILTDAVSALGFSAGHGTLVVFSGAVVLLIVTVGNGLTTLMMYRLYRWSNMHTYQLGRRLLNQYVGQPYLFFVQHNSSELLKNVLTEVTQAINSGVRPFAEMVARGTVAVAIFVFLFIENATVAIVVLSVLGLSYGGVYQLMRTRLSAIGHRIRQHSLKRFKATQEGFSSIKLVKTMGLERMVDENFSAATYDFAQDETKKQVYSNLPRYFLETIVISLMVGTIMVLAGSGDSLTPYVSTAAVYAFASLRLMPALQVVLRSLSQIRAATPVIDNLIGDLTSPMDPEYRAAQSEQDDDQRDPLEFTREVVLDQVSFVYPETQEPALRGVSFTIRRGSTVAFVGQTGCGKTTLIDVLMGLLPYHGSITIDGAPLSDENRIRWRRRVGYVPQDVYLTDESIARNIAFGIDETRIDMERVQAVARVAQIDDFIRNSLTEGYRTEVGERGVRLSGGQVQRIGIARALYRNPEVIVFDEATSALDTRTEAAVMEGIRSMEGDKTIIMIAHRLSTVESADEIFLLDQGQIVASGPYHSLLQHSEDFQRLARSSS